MALNYRYRLTIIVPANRQTAANNWWKANIDSDGGEFTFTNPLSSTGSAPATHYWASMAASPSLLLAIEGLLRSNAAFKAILSPTTVGPTRPIPQSVRDRVADIPNLRVTQHDPEDLLERNGLQRVES